MLQYRWGTQTHQNRNKKRHNDFHDDYHGKNKVSRPRMLIIYITLKLIEAISIIFTTISLSVKFIEKSKYGYILM